MSSLAPRHLILAVKRRRRRAAIQAKRRAKLLPHYVFAGHGRRRLNVTLVLRNAKKPTSSTFIRLLSPLSRPAFGRIGLEIVDPKDPWVSRRAAVCIVQRTAFANSSTACRFLDDAHRKGCVVIVDNDDAFSTLGPDHPQYTVQAERAQVLDEVMREADEVWLSTDDLRAVHALPTATVVRNTLDLDLWLPQSVPDGPRDPDAPLRLLYMGTTTHDGDLALVAPALDRLHETHPGSFMVVVVGVANDLPAQPWMQILKPPSGAYQRFVPWLVGSGPYDLGLSPLVDSAFNRAKSDVKCLDYLALGARPVVSDLPPYESTELDELIDRVPDDPGAWFTVLERYVVHRAELRRSAPASRAAGIDYVISARSADYTARLLRARIDALVSAAPARPRP